MSARLLVLVGLLAASGAARAETYACASDTLRVFADVAAFADQPIRILAMPASLECYGIAIDRERGEVWIAGNNAMAFPLAAQGAAAPLRTISIGAASLGFAVSIAVDPEADEVVVGTADGRIHTFPRRVASPAPTRSMNVSATVFTIAGIGLDRARGEIVASSYTPPSVLAAFPRNATGATGPVRPPLAGQGGQLALNPGLDLVLVVSGQSVLATRAQQSLATLVGSNLERPYGLALLPNGEMLVGDQDQADLDPIKRYAASPIGPPLSTLFAGAPSMRTLFGLATTREPACAAGGTTSCQFRDGFEQPPD